MMKPKTSKKGKNKSPASKTKKNKKSSETHPTVKVQELKSKNVEKDHVVSNAKKFINRKNRTLKERMEFRIKGAKFRIMNERLYTSNDKEVKTIFDSRDEFEDYHEGFRQQVNQWPINPLSVIIKSIRRYLEKKTETCIADFGCGEAELAKTFTSCKVHSFDLYATNEYVTAGDMAKTKLPSESVDIAVFSLSLMGSSNSRYIQEANRVLKLGGMLKVAEVESRFDNPNRFIDEVAKHGFKLISQNTSHNVFMFFNFQKVSDIGKKRKKNLPDISLNPCMYKKR